MLGAPKRAARKRIAAGWPVRGIMLGKHGAIAKTRMRSLQIELPKDAGVEEEGIKG